MTIASIDERSNDYGNKNTWVSSKDVWNNMTLSDVENLPKNSNGIPELPLYKFKPPGKNKKKYNQIRKLIFILPFAKICNFIL